MRSRILAHQAEIKRLLSDLKANTDPVRAIVLKRELVSSKEILKRILSDIAPTSPRPKKRLRLVPRPKKKPPTPPRQKFKYLLVLDFEATCENLREKSRSFIQEIIEFPVMVIDLTSGLIAGGVRFHRYVKPVVHPKLTAFCIKLTGIEQHQVDQAEPLHVVYREFVQWLSDNNFNGDNALVCTCGNWDLKIMWPRQARLSELETPEVFRSWANIKKAYWIHYKRKPVDIMTMLNDLNIPHTGRLHSGIDDVFNLCEICCRMWRDGVRFDHTD